MNWIVAFLGLVIVWVVAQQLGEPITFGEKVILFLLIRGEVEWFFLKEEDVEQPTEIGKEPIKYA